ncbi:MAG: hypothetical protein U1F35_22305 [Steroidobacteraceae bacterium]
MAGRTRFALRCSPRPRERWNPRARWQLQCMGCHHPDGAGEADRVPSLRETLVPFSASEDGRRFMIRVPGVAQSMLSDPEVAALLNWMVHNLSEVAVPQDYRQFTAAEVAAARRQPLAAVKAERERLLGLIADRAPVSPSR